ncbi:MAG TPA: carboxypeptidase regulatory-like domain-containing protein [Terriglobales bacterium]|nr:carboxypeptidase regulatory-like domain-containing protein [Terriglobales bacterium]
MRFRSCTIFLILAMLVAGQTTWVFAQSLTSGDLAGTVTDPSGAVVPNASVTVKSNESGSTQTRPTNAQGSYRFSLLGPGTYTISVSASGFQSIQQQATVTVGQAATANVQLALGTASQTIEVSAGAEAVQSENAEISTTITQQQISQTPNPGNDLSYIVQTAPGAVMNTQAGYGNSSTFGLPATSNIFTVDGMNENDPFLNLNNSGATNLLLGKNDIREATVVNNGYSGQYGGLAGANVNYVTRSGSNAWHGNAEYFWNGRAMNANNYFNVQSGVERPFVNANQWAASVGGPIRKDKTFFFVNYEGLRVVLPTTLPVNVPSPQFQAATLANLQGSSPQSVPFYQQMFNLYNGANGSSGAQNILQNGTDPNTGNIISGPGCGSFTGLGDTTTPCALQFHSTAGNFTHEYLVTGRLDQNIGSNDRLFVHFRTDHGTQATYTDPINPVFNAVSTQPQYEGQLQENHTFGTSMVNQFILSGSWYSAIFSTANLGASTQAMPFRVSLAGGAFYPLGRNLDVWPQGRNVTQYGAVDDVSWQKGSHSLKFGINFRRNDITDYSPGIGSIGFSFGDSLQSFFNGNGDNYLQNFAVRPTQPVSVYALGFYAQDEWAVRPNLKLTLSLRGDHNSNPTCQTNCFARLDNSFLAIDHSVDTPYNQTIQTGLNQALANYTKVSWQPRFGFAWSPFGSSRNTVIRGGFGLFTDAFPATIADNLLNNSPLNNPFQVGTAPLSPVVAGNQASLAAGANTSFVQGFAAGQTLAQIEASNPFFVVPSFTNAARRIIAPQYQEWNLEVQHGFGRATTLSLNYVGNHGVHEAVQNPGLNAFGFGGLPANPLDQRFGTINEVSTIANSNYNGLTASLRHQFHSVQVQANYTWSHALDEVSNAGFLQYTFNTNTSVLSPQNPFNLRGNYGNADYDARHYFSFNYVWDIPRFWGPRAVFGDWTVSGTIFARTGLPFTVVDSNATSILASNNFGGVLNDTGAFVFANYLGGAPSSCSASAVNTPCFTTAMFSQATSGLGVQRRNQFYGPNFFDTDFTVMKNFRIPRWESGKLGVGLQFFNLFNHPNFDQPVGDVSNPSFGSIITTVSTPTSILGSFLGGDASPRLIQVKASLTF